MGDDMSTEHDWADQLARTMLDEVRRFDRLSRRDGDPDDLLTLIATRLRIVRSEGVTQGIADADRMFADVIDRSFRRIDQEITS